MGRQKARESPVKAAQVLVEDEAGERKSGSLPFQHAGTDRQSCVGRCTCARCVVRRTHVALG